MASKIIVDQLEKTGGALTALTLPVANATVGQYLKNDGAGVLGWVDPPADVSGFDRFTVVTASNATFALQSTTTKLVIEVQASGGTAGSTDSPAYSGGNGGGGAYAIETD